MTTASIQELEDTIDDLVQKHLAAYEAKVRAAVQAAASRGASRLRPTPKPQEDAKVKPKRASRRPPEVLAALGKRFYAEVEKTPGETMTVLAPRLGLTAQVLDLPVRLLKRAKQVRTVGKGTRTRYFPMETPPVG